MIQQGAVELPGDIVALPIPYWTWLLLLTSGALLLWRAFGWLRELQQRRLIEHGEKLSRAEVAHAAGAARALALLHEYVLNLSSDQRREAECLSHLLREQIGRSLAKNCHSATDEQLLSEACIASQVLVPLLTFVSSILYANQRASVATWNATLRDVAVWMNLQEDQS